MNHVRRDSVFLNSKHAPPYCSIPLHLSKKDKKFKVHAQAIGKHLNKRNSETDTENLTIYDIIHHNPSSNPIIPNNDYKEAITKEKKETSELLSDEEDMDENHDATPAPQIKLGPDGEIIIDEESLVINRSEKRRPSKTDIQEAGHRAVSRSAPWSAAETVRFYRALAAIGTDFSLMASLFPNRKRRDIKFKFKKEERLNGELIDKAFRCGQPWDAEQLRKQFATERETELEERLVAARECEGVAERARRSFARMRGITTSRAAKALECDITSYRLLDNSNVVTNSIGHCKKCGRKDKAKVTERKMSTQNRNKVVANRTMNNQENRERPKHLTIPRLQYSLEIGSLVILQTENSQTSGKTSKTYMKKSDGTMVPVEIPPHLLNNMINCVKTETNRTAN